MADLTPLRIPSRHRPALSQLSKLDADALKRLETAVDQREHVSSTSRLSRVIEEAGFDSAREWVEALLALALLRQTHPVPARTLAAQVTAALGEDAGEADLSQVLAGSALVRLAKAYDVTNSHERLFHTGRIFSEVRLIFDEEVSGPPHGAVVLHQLELAYYRDDDIQTVHVTMDDDDLDVLAVQIARARDKARETKKMFKEQRVEVFAPEELT